MLRGLVISSVPLFSGIFLLSWGKMDERTLTEIRETGKEVTGTVQEVGVLKSRRGQSYHLIIDYLVSERDTMFRQKFIFPKSEYDSYRVGNKIPVAYLREKPANAIAGKSGFMIGSNTGSAAVGVVLILVGSFALYLLLSGCRLRTREAAAEKLEADLEPEEGSDVAVAPALAWDIGKTLTFDFVIGRDRLMGMKHVDLSGVEFAGDKISGTCVLSIHAAQTEPEDSDPLSASLLMKDQKDVTWQARSLLHPAYFYDEFVRKQSVEKRFVGELSKEELTKLNGASAFGPIHTMDDDREYFSLRIGTENFEMRSKYLGVEFHLLPQANRLLIHSSGVYDAEMEPIPPFVFELPDMAVLFDNHAIWGGEDDPIWFYGDPQPLRFEGGDGR